MVENLPADAGDVGLIPGAGRSAGKGKDKPLQYPCLGNSMDRGAGWSTAHPLGSQKSRTQLRD